MIWEMVIGLETHVELATKSKIFCGCTNSFGGEPNTHCCPVCTGQPGSLPVLNRQVVEFAAIAGMVTNCRINKISKMDRKHYVYPDLPKAYQISQFDQPLCVGGYVELKSGKRINLTRIHIEEDAGKLVHGGGKVFVDYNRGGVPLIEIVSEPDIRSAEEAVEYLEKLQSVLRAAGVSDCRMQEGSMRCDVNISLRHPGEEFGTRTEVKNLNSFVSVSAAIAHEYERQREILESGGKVVQETLHFDANTGETSSMRGKENADDYRYFRDPDIISINLSEADLERLRSAIPELPDSRFKRYVEQLGIAEADARLLVKYKKVSDYFEEASKETLNPKTAANLIISQMFSLITTEIAREQWSPKTTPLQLRELILLLEGGSINRNLAKQTLSRMLEDGKPATEHLTPEDLASSDSVDIVSLCKKAIDENPAAVSDYKNGKEKALKSLIGFVMKESKGRASAPDVEAELKKNM